MDWLKDNWKTVAYVSGGALFAGLMGFLIKRKLKRR